MRLTPADVHNVAFKKPSIGKRGYDEDEVDAFLDLVEAELTRLIEENNELTQRLAAYESGAAPPTADYQPLHERSPARCSRSTRQHGRASRGRTMRPPGPGPRSRRPSRPGRRTRRSAGPEPVSRRLLPEPAPVAEAPAAPVAAAPAWPGCRPPPAGRPPARAGRGDRRPVTAEAAEEAENVRSAARAESEKLLTDSQRVREVSDSATGRCSPTPATSQRMLTTPRTTRRRGGRGQRGGRGRRAGQPRSRPRRWTARRSASTPRR